MRKLLILFPIIILSGCVMIAAGAASGLIYDKRSVVTLEKDTRIFHLIHNEVVKNKFFASSNIEVTSFNKVVLLTGQVNNEAVKFEIAKIARNTPNVERVYNELIIRPPLSIAQKSQDAFLTSQVRAKLLAKPNLESGSIRVVTQNSVVYLMGIVTREQAELAVDVARNITQVNKVVKVFRYIQ